MGVHRVQRWFSTNASAKSSGGASAEDSPDAIGAHFNHSERRPRSKREP
jgi:hypothetical protein